MSFLSRLFKRGKDDPPARKPSSAHAPTPSIPSARARPPQPVAKPEPAPSPRARPPAPKPEPAPSPRAGPPAPKPEPEPEPASSRPVAPTQEAVARPVTAPSTHEPVVRRLDRSMDEDRARAILESVLDDLGTAHHRPFSRG